MRTITATCLVRTLATSILIAAVACGDTTIVVDFGPHPLEFRRIPGTQ